MNRFLSSELVYLTSDNITVIPLPGSVRKVTVRSHHLSKGCDCNISSHINMQVYVNREWGVENLGVRHAETEHRVPKLTFSRSPASQTCRSCTQSMPKFISTLSNKDVHTRFVGLWWKLNSELCIETGNWIQSGPLSALVNDMLLEHCHAVEFMCYLWLLLCYNSKAV